MIIFDTTFLIDVLKDNDVALFADSLMNDDEILATTVFNKYELLKNVYPKEKFATEKLLSKLTILKFNDEEIRTAVRIFNEQKEKGKIIPEIDLLIASICITNSAKILTRNTKDFQNISGLEVKSY